MTVKQIQCLLACLGYYEGDIDGVWGTQSETATREFQSDFGGITVDGIAGETTQKALRHAVCYGIEKAETPSEETSGSFWDEIDHFEKIEFACKCGKCGGFPQEPKEKLIRVAEAVRKHFNQPVTVSSGVRCVTHNARVGGVSNSRHLSGKAMDFCVRGQTAKAVLAYVSTFADIRYSYAIDGSFVHMDIE